MDNTLQQLLDELKTVTYNSRPNIKYQDQMDLIEKLENELKNYVKFDEPVYKTETVIDFDEPHITYPVENPVLIPKQKGRKPKES
jgi:hypothetical protein